MKKIFAVSLIAMTAVSAANAQIASKAYVDVSSNGNIVLTTNTAGQNIRALDQAIGQLPEGKTAAQAIADAVSGASSAYQPKSSGASIGGEGGTWTALTADQLAAMNSGIDATKRAGYDTLVTNAASYGDIVTHNVSEFATSAQGGKADTAVQPGDLATVATTGAYSDLSDTPTVDQSYNASSTNAQSGTAVAGAIAALDLSGTYQAQSEDNYAMGNENGGWTAMTQDQQDALNSGINATKRAGYDTLVTNAASYGDIVTHNVSEFATSTQGGKADTALQPADITTTGSNGVNASNNGGAITVSGVAATTSAAGVVQLADSAAVSSGTAGRVVDAAQLKTVADAAAAAQTAADGSIQSVTKSGTGNLLTNVATDANGAVTITVNGTALVDPATSNENGVYVLTATTSDGTATYAWEQIARASGN